MKKALNGLPLIKRLASVFQVIHDDWNVAAVAHKAYDLEHKTVGTLGAGSIGQEMMKRLQVR